MPPAGHPTVSANRGSPSAAIVVRCLRGPGPPCSIAVMFASLCGVCQRQPEKTSTAGGNSRASLKDAQEAKQVLALHRDTAFRWRDGGPRDMKEYGAPPCPRARRDIIIEHGDHIVNSIVPQKSLRARRIRQRDFAIVIAVRGRVAPAEAGTQRLYGKRGLRPPHPVGAIIHLCDGPDAQRGCSVPLLFPGFYAALSERSRKR